LIPIKVIYVIGQLNFTVIPYAAALFRIFNRLQTHSQVYEIIYSDHLIIHLSGFSRSKHFGRSPGSMPHPGRKKAL
jgi:hypothetical protein